MPEVDVLNKPQDRDAVLASFLNSKKGQPRLVCPECGAQKIVPSRPQVKDNLTMCFLAKTPYRCLRCYHRYWLPAPFFADRRRVWTWAILLSVLLMSIALVASFFINQNTESRVEAIPLSTTAEDSATAEDSTTAEEQNNRLANGTQNARSVVTVLEPQSDDSALSNRFEAGEIKPNEALVSSTKRLSPEQLERKIALAKEQVAKLEINNQQRAQQLQKQLGIRNDEQQSLLKLDINYELEQWKMAWELGDSVRYLSFYSQDFVPANGASLDAWKKQRQQRVTPAKKIRLTLQDYDVSFDQNNTHSRVVFTQIYQSNRFTDTTRKQLVLRKESQRWKIIAEKSLFE